jgi:hypothetical protein
MLLHYSSLEYFLNCVAGNCKEQKIDLVNMVGVSKVAYDDFRINIKPLNVDERTYNEQLSFIILKKLFWSLIPRTIFESPDPDFRRYAMEICKNKLNLEEPDIKLITNLTKIYKNLRNYYRSGRNTTTLNLSCSEHDSLLKNQNGRCALCFYGFTATDIDQSFEGDSTFDDDPSDFGEHDMSIKKMSRRPELDHIVPHFIGGDKPTNWQILCKVCNSGKSHSLGWIFRPGWQGISKIKDGFTLTPSIRYMVLARDRRCRNKDCCEKHGMSELRIRKIHSDQLIYIENLETICEACV